MTPQQFVDKWKRASAEERKHAQEHFIDLCRLIAHPTPAEADTPEDFCFERGVKKSGGGDGWADVWKRGCFAWEYKGRGKDLGAALVQLQRYAPALDNPPLLVVSDIGRIEIHTNWTNTVHKVYEIDLSDLARPENLQRLRWLFDDPERLRPEVTTVEVTDAAAKRFAQLAQRLRDRHFDPQRVAHFLSRIVFCLFAEDVGLLPGRMFARLLDAARKNPAQSETLFRQLFAVMHKGGLFGVDTIEWFNGGLFNDDDALPLEPDDIAEILDAAKLDWSAIEPSIFGTLFERGLDPSKRSQLGAHYTDPQTIMRLVQPVVEQPLLEEWAQIKALISDALDRVKAAKSSKTKKVWHIKAENLHKAFVQRLANFRVLDPACGSGNFLYLALQTLKNIEHRAMLEAEQLGLHREFAEFNVGVQCVQGIELNAYAAELARMTVWIGDISWSIKHGVQLSKQPILKNLERIECRDAIVNEDGSEAIWPSVDCIVGNPPFLGNKKLLTDLGDEYIGKLRECYESRVAAGVDLVMYWFEKARVALEQGHAKRVGLVATNSVRGGANRKVIEHIMDDATIFDAWSDEAWVNEGAAVRVSLICFSNAVGLGVRLNGRHVTRIHSDLTATDLSGGGLDLTRAVRLSENSGVVFQGIKFVGGFEVSGDLARAWLRLPRNPNGAPNSIVVAPWTNGMDITRRREDHWLIDFGASRSEQESAFFEAPFAHLVATQKKSRATNREALAAKRWWLHQRPRPEMRCALALLNRYIATPEVSKFRVFVFMQTQVLPSGSVYAIARQDDEIFGVLHSRFHEVWSLRMGTSLEDRPRYTPTTTFETFPFPVGLTPNLPPERYSNPFGNSIATAARRLNALRDSWLNPVEWIEKIPEVLEGWPDRIVAKAGHEVDLKGRTLTSLYNAKPAWLGNAHHELDATVAKAYAWDDYNADMPDDEILRRLLAMNLARARENRLTPDLS